MGQVMALGTSRGHMCHFGNLRVQGMAVESEVSVALVPFPLDLCHEVPYPIGDFWNSPWSCA